jgi:hypothetical protein
MPSFRPPAVMELRPDVYGAIDKLWVFNLTKEGAFGKSKLNQYFTPEVDLLRFCQLLAKIAYSYSMIIEKPVSFTLDRIPIIDGSPSDLVPLLKYRFEQHEFPLSCFTFVGGITESVAPSKFLHEIGHGVISNGGALFSVIYIRLFANLGAPIYMVVADYKI